MATEQSVGQRIKNLYHLLIAAFAAFWAGYPGRRLRVIGVTGTDGKTTTTSMIYHLLKTSGVKVALINTIQACIGDEEIPTGLHVTSQDPRHLQPLLKRIQKLGYEAVVLETTSHGLAQHRVFGVNFEVAVMTNLHDDHLDYHGTMERYLAAKARLFARQPKVKVLNRDDASFELLSTAQTDQTWVYSQAASVQPAGQNSLWASEIKASVEGLSFNICVDGECRPTSMPLIGSYNIANALAAAGAALGYGCSLTEIADALPSLPQIRGRMQKVPTSLPFTVLVDFAHTPAALSSALGELRKITLNRLIVVFGCAGQRDPGRRAMGLVAARQADLIVITNEDNRTERIDHITGEIARQAEEGGARKGNVEKPEVGSTPMYFCISDRQKAIEFALGLARAGDVVDITGKGHEQSLNVDGDELPWDDVSEVAKALASLPKT